MPIESNIDNCLRDSHSVGVQTLCSIDEIFPERPRVHRLCWILMIGLLVIGSFGCSRTDVADPSVSTPSDGNVGDQNEATAQSKSAGSGSPATQGKSRGRDEIYVDDKGQKWFGNVPYDVFFDDPHAVASNTTTTGRIPEAGVSATTTGSETASAVVSVTDPVVPAGAAAEPMNFLPEPAAVAVSPNVATSNAADTNSGWSSLISVAALDDEVKSIRNFLNENLQSVGNYNSSMLMIPPKAAALAVLAGIAMEHPESVSWKSDAIYIRDLAKQMNSAPLQRGAKDQKRLLALFESIADTLDRSRPAGLSEPPTTDSFADVSEMRFVMMRMEEAEKRMRTEAGSESAFNSSRPMVQHEAALLATMSHTVTLPGYGYEDDPEFVGYGRTMIEAATTILDAAEAGNFSGYELALSKISSTCQACHSRYKND